MDLLTLPLAFTPTLASVEQMAPPLTAGESRFLAACLVRP